MLSIDPTATFAIQPGATLDLDPAASLDFTVNLGAGISPSDVRYGVSVGNTTGTCRVPFPSSVALGMPVDSPANATALGFPANTQPTGVANLGNGLLGTGNSLSLASGDDYLYTDGRAIMFGIPDASIDLTTAASFALEFCQQTSGMPDGESSSRSLASW